MRGFHAGIDHVLVPLLERRRLALSLESPLLRLVGVQPDQFELLLPAAVRGARLQAEVGHLIGQVLARLGIARTRGPATAVCVAGYLCDDLANVGIRNLFRRICRSVGFGLLCARRGCGGVRGLGLRRLRRAAEQRPGQKDRYQSVSMIHFVPSLNNSSRKFRIAVQERRSADAL